MSVFSPENLARHFNRLAGPDTMKAQRNAFRRVVTRMRTEVINRVRAQGIGRALWGKNAAGARKMVKLGRIRPHGHGFTTELAVKGLAAMQETGGRTKRHPIRPKVAKVLAFKMPGNAQSGFAQSVQHPGSQIPVHPSLGPTIERRSAEGSEEMRKAVDGEIRRK